MEKEYPALLTVDQVAEITGIQADTWRKWAVLGRLPIPKIKVNRLLRFSKADVLALVAGRVNQPDPRRRGRPTKAEALARQQDQE